MMVKQNMGAGAKKKKNTSGRVSETAAWLAKHRGHYLPSELATKCDSFSPDLLPDLKTHSKVYVSVDEAIVCYKPLHEIRNRKELLEFVKSRPHGSLMKDVEDAYVGLPLDVQGLVADKRLCEIYNPDKQSWVIFPVDESEEQRRAVDADVAQLWNEVVMPTNATELERQLVASGHMTRSELEEKPVVGLMTRKRGRKGGMAAKKQRRQKLTNTHMIDKVEWLNDGL
jgi:hypothetical protein